MKTVFAEYASFLFCSTHRATATNFGKGTGFGHDSCTRFLAQNKLTSASVWQEARHTVEELATNDGVLIVDDTIIHKPYMKENGIVSWFFDHTTNRTVKGVNLLSLLYQNEHISVAIGAECVEKEDVTDISSASESVQKAEEVDKEEEETAAQTKGVRKMKVVKTKNEMFRQMLAHAAENTHFKWVLADSWYCNSENMKAVRATGAHFIFAAKSNLRVALTPKHAAEGKFIKVGALDALGPGMYFQVWLPGFVQPVFIMKEVFKNEGPKQAVRYLVASDPTLNTCTASAIYQRRWKVEEYHRSLKQEFSVEKCPARSKKAQNNHIIAAVMAHSWFNKLQIFLKKTPAKLKQDYYIKSLENMIRVLFSRLSTNSERYQQIQLKLFA